MKSRSRRTSRHRIFQRKALALAIGSIAFGIAGGAWAQATEGTIHGRVPVAAGETIQITGGSGYNRTLAVGPSGRYSVTLPVGTYSVSLLQNGKVVQTKTDVSPVAAGAVIVNFTSSASAKNVETLNAITVTANEIPPIDVTTTNQVTTITAKELQTLPLARTAENIAMLAPGVTPGAASFSGMTGGGGPLNKPFLVFGGASIAENAYYLDGMNTTDALTGQGGITLPYGAIQEQQTFTTGYGAKYGRSIGGVINQIGKSGSNQWHFGVQGSWQPGALESSYVDNYWNNPRSTTPGQEYGQLRTPRKYNSSMENTYDAYVSGPIVKDKLFFFLSAEQDIKHVDVGNLNNPSLFQRFTEHYPKIYAKLNWNINDNNILTLTGVQNSFKQWVANYNFTGTPPAPGSFNSLGQTPKNTFRVWVANYTSYLSNNLTLHAMFGKMHGEYWDNQPGFPGFDPMTPNISSASKQNPAFWPPGTPSSGVTNQQVAATLNNQSHRDSVTNYRLSLDWKLPWNLWGTHDIQFGIDNLTTWDREDGTRPTGPDWYWAYNFGDPGKPIAGTNPAVPPYAGPPDSNGPNPKGYYVSQVNFTNLASVRVAQRAQYVEDNWQITPDFLLNIGLRNDSFVNDNPAGQPYVRQTKPQWAPRIGFSWNVHGDSTLKVFGNAGRYYLALPAAVALREAGASIFTNYYYTYTGINSLGEPTGLTPLPMNNGGNNLGPPPGLGVSANNEYGEPLDPRMVSAQNLKPEYSDNFVLGLQQEFNFLHENWVAGATAIYQRMGRISDDWDDQQAMCAAGRREGFAYLTSAACGQYTLGSVLINPGSTEDILVKSPSGTLNQIVVTPQDQGFVFKPMRNYYALDMSLSHPWDGKWFAKADLVFSRSYGNTEGPVDSVIGQGGPSVSITEQWDFRQVMEYSLGDQPNDQKWQFKLYGAYAIDPEWTVGANLFIASGHPNVCLGRYGPTQNDPFNYGNAYHWCGGQPAPPGSTGFTQWTHELDINANYSPKWAAHKLNFNVAVFNVFDEQTPLQYNSGYGTTASPNPLYQQVLAWMPPRSVRFTVNYNF